MSYIIEAIHLGIDPDLDPGYDIFENEDTKCQILYDGEPLITDYLHFNPETDLLENYLDDIVRWFNDHLSEEQKEITGFPDGVIFDDIETSCGYMEILPYYAAFDIKKETDAFSHDKAMYPELYN